MDLEHTNNLAMPLLIPNQSGKEITHNEALIILDNIVQKSVVDKDLSTPPENPENNVLYIVGQNATNEWENKENYLTYFDNGWRFITPKNGFVFFIEDENKLYNFNGTSWVEIAPNFTPSITSLQNLSHLGINATANSTNKLTVKSDFVLFDNVTANSTVKINKNAESNTASITLQNNNTSKAEFGLIANDDLTLKVSNDGENWNNAFVVDKATGNIDFKGSISINGNSITNNSGFNLIFSVSITENTQEIILNVDNTKRYKIFINNLKGDQTVSTTAYLHLQFGDDSSFNSTENYAYGSERIFTGGIWTFAPESQKNLTSLPIKYTDAGIYNGSGFNAELNLTECNGNNPTIYGDIAANRSVDAQSLRVLFDGTLKQQYNYTKIRLFPSTGYLVSGNIKLYEI